MSWIEEQIENGRPDTSPEALSCLNKGDKINGKDGVWVYNGDGTFTYVTDRNPTKNDDINSTPNFIVGDLWKNRVTGEVFLNRDNTDGHAKWIKKISNTKPGANESIANGYRPGDEMVVKGLRWVMRDDGTWEQGSWSRAQLDGRFAFKHGQDSVIFRVKTSTENKDAVNNERLRGYTYDKSTIDSKINSAKNEVTNGYKNYTYSKSEVDNRINDALKNNQPDWNQTNTASPSYIKHKPIIILPECGTKNGVPSAGDFTNGKKLIVDISDTGKGKCYKRVGGVVKEVK